MVTATRQYSAGQYSLSAQEYKWAAQRIPCLPNLWEKAGEAYFQAKDYPQSLNAYQMASNRHELSLNGYMHMGDIALSEGDASLAVKLWSETLQNGGKPELLLPRLADGYESLLDYNQESLVLQEYLAIAPEDAAALYNFGLLQAASNPASASDNLIHAAQRDTTLDASVQTIRTAINTALLSDDKAYQLVVTGRALGSLGKWNLASLAFRNALQIRPEYADAWAWLAEAVQQLNQDGKAEIDKARSLDPRSAMVQSLYGLYLQRQRQPFKALTAFQTAVALEPNNPAWQMALGRAYELTDDLVAALEHYQRAVELAPDDANVWRALAEFCLRDSIDLKGIGLPAAEHLLELADNDWRSYDIKGQIMLETGDPTKAEELLKKAAELGPTQPAPLFHLGVLYLQKGDRNAAYSHLLLARDYDPGGAYGWQARRLLEQFFP